MGLGFRVSTISNSSWFWGGVVVAKTLVTTPPISKGAQETTNMITYMQSPFHILSPTCVHPHELDNSDNVS